MARDISIVVAITTNPDSTVIETEVSGGDEPTRADVTELVLAHLGELWARLERTNSIRAVGHISQRRGTTESDGPQRR